MSETPPRGLPTLSADMTIRAKAAVWIAFAGAVVWATTLWLTVKQQGSDIAEIKQELKSWRPYAPGPGTQARNDP